MYNCLCLFAFKIKLITFAMTEKYKLRSEMENNAGQWLLNIIGALGGWELVKWILNRKAMKRKAIADAVAVETDSLIKRYSAMESEMEKLKEKVDELYKMVHQLENEKLELIKHNMELELALKEAKHNECRRPDDECLRRLPPREICLAKKLLGGYYDKDDGVSEKPDKGEHA